MPQAVCFLQSAFPFSKGDSTVLQDEKLAEELREKKVVEFVKHEKKADAGEPPAPPAPPPEDAADDPEIDDQQEDGEGDEDLVEIPDDWEKLHHTQIMKLAKDITGAAYANVADAKGTIKDELARRAAAGE